MAVGWVISAAPIGPPFVRVAGAERVGVYRFGAALPMAYVVSGESGVGSRLVLGPSRATVHVDTAIPATLVITQNDAPGWHVAIDGAEAKKVRAFDAFRAVFVPAGAHEVVWTYRPRSILFGGVVTFFTIAALIISSRFVKHRAHENFFRDTLKSVGNRDGSEV
jgi:hypothetical protein